MAIDPVTGAVMSNRATVEGWLDGLPRPQRRAALRRLKKLAKQNGPGA